MIYTSYFGNIRKIKAAFPDAALISIAGKSPDWYNGLKYEYLAPKYSWWKEWHDKFKDDYDSTESMMFYSMRYAQTVLSGLDPHEVKCDLYNMANAKTVFLLCYETPEKFCHRKLVADWLTSNHVNCCEWNLEKKEGRNEDKK